ncbi:MAG TPA: J domain-containing protein [Rubrobacter sp.]|nr:J domain-containing protein [Rubrobacter sp.]
MGIPRRLGRIARGIVSNLQEDERFRERLRTGRERSETLRGAFEAALRGAAEEWRRAEERRAAEERAAGASAGGRRATGGWRPSAAAFTPNRYPPNVLAAYHRLDLPPGAPLESVDRKRRELVKRHHPDRFSEPDARARAERLTAEINAAHDALERYLTKGS